MRIALILIVFYIGACSNSKKATSVNTHTTQKVESEKDDFKPVFMIGPPAIVYKTKKDYNNLVPVTLSDDKKEIISYPDPKDVIATNGFQTPSVLSSGYLLDNRGINENLAFLSITYEEYSRLKSVPGLKELYAKIIDKDPLVELCDCGNRKHYKDIIPQLNNMITKNKLKTLCKPLLK